jgi:hypothetical protein
MKKLIVAAIFSGCMAGAAWAAPDPNPDPSKPGLGPPTGRTEHTSCKAFGQATATEAQAPGPYGRVRSANAQGPFGQLQLEAFCEPKP